MRKKLLIAIALLVSGVGNLWADDVFKEVTGKITNPSFEDAGATTGDIQSGDITTGWTYTSQNNGRVSIFNSSSSVETYGSTSPSADKYFMRIRGAGGGSDGTQSVSQKNTFSLTKSKYRILFDYKAARANNTEKKFTISAKNGSNVLGSKQNTISQVSANSSHFAGIEWTTDYFDFTLTATTNVTLNISCETSKASSGHTILLLDNFILEWNLTQSLKDLITEANNFLTAEGDSEGTSYKALKSAIDDADAVKESDNASTLETQYGLLEAALNLAKNHRKPWLAAKTAAEAAIANDDYENVVGEEKTNLQAAIDAAEPSTADDYDIAKSNLETKTSTFTGAKANYDAFVAAKTAETPNLAYATTAKKTDVTTAKGASDATSASDADTKTAAIATALRAYYESHAAAENVATASDQTSRITDAEDPSNISAWTLNNTSGNSKMRKNNGESYTDADGTNNHTYFDSDSWGTAFSATFTQDVTLPAGNYLLTVKARGNGTTTYKLIADDDETDITSIGNTGGVFGRGWNDYSVEFSIDASKSVTLGIEVETGSSSNWISFGDFRLIKLDATYANSDDYDALAAAISTIESSLGFDDGEYAPYNVASALAAAKAFNPAEDNIQSEVQDATAALEALSTNVGEVNAIYWKTDYTTADKNSDGYVHPIGWTNTGYNTRFLNDELSDETVFPTIDHAIMSKYNTTYGFDSYYTMPLKASTYYTLTFRYCGWGNAPETKVVIKDGSDSELLLNPSSFTPATSDGNSNTEHWYDFAVTFKTNDTGNYKLELNKVPDGQQQIAWTNMNLIRANVTEVKSLLNSDLTEANTLYNDGANVGTGVFQIPTASGTAFSSAIETAQGVYDDGSATVDQVATAISDLQAAKTEYANATLNAPDNEKRYYLTIVRDGKAWNDNAITFMEGAANPTQGNYGIKYLTPANANMCQAVKFTNTTGNKYKVSFLTRAGTEQYITTSHLGYDAGTDNTNKERIRTVNDDSKALEIEIQATTTANQFRLYNTDRGAVIADNDNNDVFTNNSANFTISEASQASVEVSIGAGEIATRIFPFTPTLPDGVVAYSCSADDGTRLTLESVATPVANTPYILYSGSGCALTNLTGWGTAKEDSYTVDYLTGVFTRTEVPVNSYVLQKKDETLGFYRVSATGQYSSPYRVYVTVPSGDVKSFGFTLDDIETAIRAAEAEGQTTVTLRYNAAGQQIQSAQKGLNIIRMSDGSVRKVLVK